MKNFAKITNSRELLSLKQPLDVTCHMNQHSSLNICDVNITYLVTLIYCIYNGWLINVAFSSESLFIWDVFVNLNLEVWGAQVPEHPLRRRLGGRRLSFEDLNRFQVGNHETHVFFGWRCCMMPSSHIFILIKIQTHPNNNYRLSTSNRLIRGN